MRGLHTAKGITISFWAGEHQQSMKDASDRRSEDRPEWQADATKQEPHPYGCTKNVFTFKRLMLTLADGVMGYEQWVTMAIKASLNSLAQIETPLLEHGLGSVKPPQPRTSGGSGLWCSETWPANPFGK